MEWEPYVERVEQKWDPSVDLGVCRLVSSRTGELVGGCLVRRVIERHPAAGWTVTRAGASDRVVAGPRLLVHVALSRSRQNYADRHSARLSGQKCFERRASAGVWFSLQR